MSESALSGIAITLEWPESLPEDVVGQALNEPNPDTDPDPWFVEFLRDTARRFLGCCCSDTRFGETDAWTRGSLGGEDIRSGGYRVGTDEHHIHISYRYHEPEEELRSIARTEYRWYTVRGLPEGQRLDIALEREWIAQRLRAARARFLFQVPEYRFEQVGNAFRARFDIGTRHPRVFDLVPPDPGESLQVAWEGAVRVRHACADLGAYLDTIAADRFDHWKFVAERGDVRGITLVGDCYLLGKGGVKRDPAEAARWYQQAVERDDLTAMVNLAELLDARDGELYAPEQASALFQLAADAGDARAQGLLGKRHFTGAAGFTADPIAARRLFEQGADGDDSRSQNNLATMLLGDDNATAEKWFRRAAERGDPVACSNLGNILWDGRVRTSTADRDEAVVWFRRAAQLGYAKAQARLGQMYVLGEDCDKDPTAARYWFLRAARQGQTIAQLNVGVMYEKGDGGPVSFDDAELWFRTAANAGNETAKQYHADITRWHTEDVARRAAAGTLPYTNLPSKPILRSRFRNEEPGENDETVHLPNWAWTCGWKTFSLSMPDPSTVEFVVAEDETQTEGRAHYGSHPTTFGLTDFLIEGPPDEVLEESYWSALLPVLESVIDDIGCLTPDWLEILRYHYAVRVSSIDVIRDRYLSGNSATILDPLGGRDALYWAVRAQRPEVIEFLVREFGYNPNTEYPNGFRETLTTLMVAARELTDESDLAVFDTLRANGVDLEAQNDRGETVLHWLLGSANADGVWRPAVFSWLLKNGADPNALRPAPEQSPPHLSEGWTPLFALVTSRFLPEVKYQLACALIAAGATVAAMPEPLRDRFRTAFRSWDRNSGRVGKTLATRPNDENWIDNLILLFRDAVEDVEAPICEVGNGSISNYPYAPDDDFSFTAVLHAVADALFVRVVKVHTRIEVRDQTELWFESTTGGREWSERSSAPDLTASAVLHELPS